MSEYQYLAFRAIDRPLTDKELEYAHSQSSRAEITRWSFENEYHFGDFRGDPEKLLTRGYDIHLHYANYGVRKVMMRLPSGPPFSKSVWTKYVDGERLTWKKDKKGPAGTLILSPFNDGGTIDQIWEPDEYVDDVVAVRNDLVRGDGRVLYVLWLCGCGDGYINPSELVEPPVPAGIGHVSASLRDLMGFFGLDPLTLNAAGGEFNISVRRGRPRSPIGSVARESARKGSPSVVASIRLGQSCRSKSGRIETAAR